MPRLSADALKSRIAALQQQLANAEKNKTPAIIKVQSLMKKLGVTLTDLAGKSSASENKAGRKRAQTIKTTRGRQKPPVKVAVKYRDNNGNAWTGRGRTPKWILEEEAAGKNREDLRVV
jgi:DNA-binding protein H-NS